jgi:RIO-like serine/threonine protein kinase
VEPYKLESGYFTKNRQVINMFIKKLEGRIARIKNIFVCKAIIRQLYTFGIVYKDLNRHNFVINKQSRIICFIDFKNTKDYLNLKAKKKIDLLKDQLVKNIGKNS